MLDLLLIILDGWPAIFATVILAIIGLVKSDYRFLVGAAILAFPFSWYLSGIPLIRSFTFLLPLLPFSAGFAMRRNQEMVAWVLAIIYFLIIVLLLFAVIAGNP